MKGRCNFMDKARKRIRVCLVCIVLTAVVIGLFYYYHDLQGSGTVNEGTLISNIEMGWKHLWQ